MKIIIENDIFFYSIDKIIKKLYVIDLTYDMKKWNGILRVDKKILPYITYIAMHKTKSLLDFVAQFIR